MQLFPLLLIVIVLAADGGMRLVSQPPVDLYLSALLACMPVVAIVGMSWLTIAICHRRIVRYSSLSSIASADRAVRYGRTLLLVNHAVALLCFGWLDAVRAFMGDLVLIDELLVIAPPMLGALTLWWAYYPVERRLRESLLVRQLDLGRTVYPTPSRWQYVLQQTRSGMLILLVPIVIILGIGEVIQYIAARSGDGPAALMIANTATLIAAAVVFVCAPLLMRLLLHVQPLPAGELRDELMAICTRHKVRVRELLLWKTGGSMINAAVMGIIGRLRYVLVTDALIESMTQSQVQAVMAHEVGHVRRHHMPWLVVCFAAVLFAALWMIEIPLLALQRLGVIDLMGVDSLLHISIMAGQLVLALIAFGWVSRRFERQADTFAVQHLSGLDETRRQQPSPRVSLEAVQAMCGALEAIAQLNAVDARRPSWRHGSIRWRQDYLASIVDRPLHALPIDRFIKYIKATAALVLLGTFGMWILF